MYVLSLTSQDRRAFDWIGDRYNAGQVASILIDHLPDDCEWDGYGVISFDVPEAIAWEIHRLAEEEGFAWPCFDRPLRNKLTLVLDQIV